MPNLPKWKTITNKHNKETNVNKRLKEFITFNASYSLPIFWILGLARAVLVKSNWFESNIILYCLTYITPFVIIGTVLGDAMKLHNVKGLYAFFSVLFSIAVGVLAMWIFHNAILL